MCVVQIEARAGTRPMQSPANEQDRKSHCASGHDELPDQVPIGPSGEHGKSRGDDDCIAHLLLPWDVGFDLVELRPARVLFLSVKKLAFAAKC